MTDAFTIARLWPEETVAVLASGPSMSADVARQVFDAMVPAIVINNTFRLAPWAGLLYAADGAWWRANPDALAFRGLKVTVDDVAGTRKLRNSGPGGFDPHPGAVRSGGHSGYQAVHIAIHGGARRILLCGFDMHGTHWHGPHVEPLRNTQPGTYGRWVERFAELQEPARERGIEILNCTPGSALKCFPMVELGDALALPRKQRTNALTTLEG